MPITGQIHPVYDAEGNAFFPHTVDGAVTIGDTTLAAKAQGWDAEKPEREAADAALGEQINARAPKSGLPVSDIRTAIVREGQSIAAGDVMRVQDGDAYRDLVAQDNVENVLAKTSGYIPKPDSMAIACLNKTYSLALYPADDIVCALLDNATGRPVSVRMTNLNTVAASVSLARLDDIRFAVQYLKGSVLYACYCTIADQSLAFGSPYSVASSVSNAESLIFIDNSCVLSIFNASGLKAKLLPISGTAVDTSKTAYALPGNTGANHISACNLPNATNGDKRVCICFSDTNDGNKGKVVIATITPSNTVTFGDVTIFEKGQVSGTSCNVAKDGKVFVAYIKGVSPNATAVSAILADNTLLLSSLLVGSTGTVKNIQALTLGEKLVCVYDNQTKLLSFEDSTLKFESSYSYNANIPTCISASVVFDNKFILAYGNASNSSYGTATLLEVSGDQIAGSFLDNSKDAIALEPGEAGQAIKLAYSGNVELPGVTAGTRIDSLGVSAYCPVDGWILVQSEGQKGYVVGEYIGTGTSGGSYPTFLDVGFKPSLVAVGTKIRGIAYTAWAVFTRGSGNGYSFVGQSNATVTYLDVLWLDTGIRFSSGVGPEAQLNCNGVVYSYVAWR